MKRPLILMLVLGPLTIGGYVLGSAMDSATATAVAGKACTSEKVAVDEGYGVSRTALRDRCSLSR
jgi:hypothetical protein